MARTNRLTDRNLKMPLGSFPARSTSSGALISTKVEVDQNQPMTNMYILIHPAGKFPVVFMR